MNTRKRRPPKRQAGRVSRLIAGGAAMIGAAAMRNPVATGGTAAFAIVFSFVAANALWYQPSSHPHPWLDTRDAFRDYAAKAMHPGDEPATTYRIERDATAPAAAPKTVDGIIVQDDAAPASNPLVADIQANLLRRGLYEGPVDGVMGSKTEAAIMFYQETRGLPQTGAADAAVLDLLKKDNAEFNVVPPDRPADVTGAIAARAPQKPVEKPIEKAAEKPAPKAADPVAALISKTPRPQPAKPPAAKEQVQEAKTESVKAARPAVAPPIPPAPIPNAAAKTQAAKTHKPAEKSVAKPVQKAVEKPADKAAQRPAPQKTVATSQRPAATPVKAEAPARSAAATAAPSNLTMAIQKGLQNLAYRDVNVDGVPGEQTKEAIRHFEKHYRLPVTGEPNEAVLEKLKKIGAL